MKGQLWMPMPISAALVLVCGLVADAGDLNPPAGPVASTGRFGPRTDVATLPGSASAARVISQPGSYYLSSNITGVSGKNGIEINAGGVSLDLNGFTLTGVAGSLDGVHCQDKDISVINGTSKNWTGDGIDLNFATNVRVADLRASSNGNFGIAAGTNAVVTGCIAYDNGSYGIITQKGCTITGCTASLNTDFGIITDVDCTISDCVADQNLGSGIGPAGGNSVKNCSAYNNNGDGIMATSGCTIIGCVTNFNDENGISAVSGTAIINCTAYFSTLDGIRAVNECTISGNTCYGNGNGGDGAGIHVIGADNRIEGNNCNFADRGIDVDAAGCIIIRNTCSGNGINWVFVANNVFGPIIDRTAPASPAVSGNSAASSLGSTDPNANFSY